MTEVERDYQVVANPSKSGFSAQSLEIGEDFKDVYKFDKK